MLRKQLYSLLAVFALVGSVAACGGEEDAALDEGAVTDTLVTPEQTTVQVPVTVPDTSVVVTDIDTMRDTVDVEQQQR